MDRPIDSGQYAVGEGGNCWALEPALEREVHRVSAETEFAWAESGLSEFGETVATDIAPNADTVDDYGPMLETDDRDGDLANVVDYHPAHLANERLAEWFVRERLDARETRPIGAAGALSDATVDAVLRYARLSPDAFAD